MNFLCCNFISDSKRCVCVVEDHLGTYWKQIFVGHLVQVWDCSDAVTEKEYKDDVERDPAESHLSSPQRCGVVG